MILGLGMGLPTFFILLFYSVTLQDCFKIAEFSQEHTVCTVHNAKYKFLPCSGEAMAGLLDCTKNLILNLIFNLNTKTGNRCEKFRRE